MHENIKMQWNFFTKPLQCGLCFTLLVQGKLKAVIYEIYLLFIFLNSWNYV